MMFKGQEVVSEDYWVEKANADIKDDDVRHQFTDMFRQDVDYLLRKYMVRYSSYIDQVVGSYADGITAEKMAEMSDEQMELFEDLMFEVLENVVNDA